MAARKAEHEDSRGGGGGDDGEETETDYKAGRYCINHNTLGTDPNVTLAYATGSELCHPTIRTIGGHRGRLERERDTMLNSGIEDLEHTSLTKCSVIKRIQLFGEYGDYKVLQ